MKRTSLTLSILLILFAGCSSEEDALLECYEFQEYKVLELLKKAPNWLDSVDCTIISNLTCARGRLLFLTEKEEAIRKEYWKQNLDNYYWVKERNRESIEGISGEEQLADLTAFWENQLSELQEKLGVDDEGLITQAGRDRCKRLVELGKFPRK